jgi:N-hydroxyarylamine O-acetyltransferase
LAELHKQHLRHVPFENLDISAGKKIYLDLDKIEDKIVNKQRGGFCYELNGLFGALLKEFGFDVKMVSARVWGKERIGQEFDHMALVVKLDTAWLADVGFGDNFLEPIRLEPGVTQHDPAGTFRIERHDSTNLRLDSYSESSGYSPNYLFTMQERKLDEFAEMCEYHQTSPESSFTQQRVCTVVTESGRITLRDKNFIETIYGRKTVYHVTDEKEYNQILRKQFGVKKIF